MNKALLAIALILSSYSFAQNKSIKDNPTFVEESMQKAGIRMKQITGYNLEYHTKSDYKDGNLLKKESFSENGHLISKETISYDNQNQIISKEIKNNNGSLVFLYTYEYSPQGYTVTKSENDVIISKTDYVLNSSKNIVSEKENNLLEAGDLFVDKINEYNKNNFLVKTIVKYNNGGYSIIYKNDSQGNPIEEEYLNNSKKLINKLIRKYDSNNNLIEETTFDAEGKVQNISKILYEYDAHKNWTKRTQYSSKFEMPISNTIRTIRYN